MFEKNRAVISSLFFMEFPRAKKKNLDCMNVLHS